MPRKSYTKCKIFTFHNQVWRKLPFEKLSPDFQIVNPSINIKSESICKYIADVIFMPDSQRKPILKTIPNDINFYPLNFKFPRLSVRDN